MSKIKVFEWCDGFGTDVIEKEWRSRVLFAYDGRVGVDSQSIVGWTDGKFVEVLPERCIWEYLQSVYEVKAEFEL